jgi:hypothetical protein
VHTSFPIINSIGVLGGAGIWSSITHVVELIRNHRSTLIWAAFLRDVRDAKCTQIHLDYLHERLIANLNLLPNQLDDIEGITARNHVRMHMNNAHVIKKAMTLGERPIVITARDIVTNVSFTPGGIKLKILHQPDTSKTKYTSGMLMVCTGVAITLKKNLATQLGLNNTAQGTLVSLDLDPREPPYNPDPSLGPHFLKYMPLSMTIDLPHATHTHIHLSTRLPRTP